MEYHHLITIINIIERTFGWDVMTAHQTQSKNSEHQASTKGVSLLDGEIVLENTHPSYSNWSKVLALAVVVLLLGVLVGEAASIGGGIVLAGILVGYVYVARKQSRYVVTDQRVKQNIGLLSSSTNEVRHEDIRSVGTNAGVIEGLMGKGTITIDSASSTGNFDIEGVSQYEDVANSIRQAQARVS